ncbi:MAG: GH3 auxin-responsive promoter family protein [Chitinophagaceae bacterium]|nr:GH3 auxin-responsive promoter family protein [Chitinophagaceae bacterium]
MALLGNIIKRSLKIQEQFRLKNSTPRNYQLQQLNRLLKEANQTAFGQHFQFKKLLKNDDLYENFKKNIPVFNYTSMYENWWHRCHQGEIDVAWPGKVKYFALSSGTSESASKHIPVTDDMVKSIKKTGFKQFCSLNRFNLPSGTFDKGVLMLGGTTKLNDNGDFYEGDMSGISAKEMPKWLSYFFYKPGIGISKRTKWEDRIKLIVRKSKSWDVAIVCGVPAWVQIVFEEIIKYHNVNNIHEIWPNLTLYIHGGVAFDPYRETFKKILGKPITYIETYMASEGSFGFQSRPGEKGISLVLNNKIFYEFIPFNETNFDEDGELKSNPEAYMIHEVVEDKDYAIILSTCSGAWRYLIGDVVRFTSVKHAEIIISGRTKQFLSLCGEHLSVDNMNKAIELVQKKLHIEIKEYTVAGYSKDNYFAHKWYLGCDNLTIDNGIVLKEIDAILCEINDDYAVERTSALKYLDIEIIPSSQFIDFLHHTGKYGAMNKFPRVLKNKQLAQWQDFIGEKV